MKTIDQIKTKITVSQELKDKQKEYRKTKKAILKTLETDPKNIPQIADENVIACPSSKIECVLEKTLPPLEPVRKEKRYHLLLDIF